MTASKLCIALALAVLTDRMPMPSSHVDLACKQASHLIEVSRSQKVDPVLMMALIYKESLWTPHVVSKAGACGLTQVVSRFVPESCEDLKRPKVAIRVGVEMFKRWKDRSSSVNEALACYNVGFLCLNSSRARGYAFTVLKYRQVLREFLEPSP